MDINEPTDRAITLMLYSMRKQMFIDGNKRTAMLAGNHIMIANGAGIITIPVEKQRQFRDMLLEFYKTNYIKNIKNFIYDSCIDGINFPKESQVPAFNGTESWILPKNIENTNVNKTITENPLDQLLIDKIRLLKD